MSGRSGLSLTAAPNIQRVYYGLTALNTLAASFIWGVNTLFLLDAGLTNSEAFAANAFFTLGQVIFEIPTGVVADTVGRRASYLIGSATLFITTLLYFWLWKSGGPFYAWALVSVFLGLGFTFFSGATEAWLVDALDFTVFKGEVEDVFARGQIAGGVAMLIGSTLGGFIAERSNLGAPYLVRAVILLISFGAAWISMRDLGFTPRKPESVLKETKAILKNSLRGGLGVRPVRWMMLMAPFMAGVSFFGFYAAQPLLLELYGDQKAFGIAGAVAALVALSQIAGGLLAPYVRKFFAFRSQVLALIVVGSVILLACAGLTRNFCLVILFLSVWGLLGATMIPIRRAYLNQLILSRERATILSFDGMMSSLGGTLIQPGLGRAADVFGYSTSFVIAGALQILALPFVYLIRKENSPADRN